MSRSILPPATSNHRFSLPTEWVSKKPCPSRKRPQPHKRITLGSADKRLSGATARVIVPKVPPEIISALPVCFKPEQELVNRSVRSLRIVFRSRILYSDSYRDIVAEARRREDGGGEDARSLVRLVTLRCDVPSNPWAELSRLFIQLRASNYSAQLWPSVCGIIPPGAPRARGERQARLNGTGLHGTELYMRDLSPTCNQHGNESPCGRERYRSWYCIPG